MFHACNPFVHFESLKAKRSFQNKSYVKKFFIEVGWFSSLHITMHVVDIKMHPSRNSKQRKISLPNNPNIPSDF